MFPFEAIAEVRLNGDGPYYIAQVRLPDSVVQPARHSYSTKEDRDNIGIDLRNQTYTIQLSQGDLFDLFIQNVGLCDIPLVLDFIEKNRTSLTGSSDRVIDITELPKLPEEPDRLDMWFPHARYGVFDPAPDKEEFRDYQNHAVAAYAALLTLLGFDQSFINKAILQEAEEGPKQGGSYLSEAVACKHFVESGCERLPTEDMRLCTSHEFPVYWGRPNGDTPSQFNGRTFYRILPPELSEKSKTPKDLVGIAQAECPQCVMPDYANPPT